jgi:serine/threonine-protein kinase RsbT
MEERVQVIPIRSDADIVTARLAVRSMAERIGFTGVDVVLIATAVSEVARNMVEYAKQGEIILANMHHGAKRGLEVLAKDEGPGISDVTQAMQDGYSTSRGLGLGLPGSKRLMDEFEIVSQVGSGTKVTMRKWLR